MIEDQWKPIETAPKDGTEIIVYDRHGNFVPWVYWDDEDEKGVWMSNFIRWAGHPTHWMAFPNPPKT